MHMDPIFSKEGQRATCQDGFIIWMGEECQQVHKAIPLSRPARSNTGPSLQVSFQERLILTAQIPQSASVLHGMQPCTRTWPRRTTGSLWKFLKLSPRIDSCSRGTSTAKKSAQLNESPRSSRGNASRSGGRPTSGASLNRVMLGWLRRSWFTSGSSRAFVFPSATRARRWMFCGELNPCPNGPMSEI